VRETVSDWPFAAVWILFWCVGLARSSTMHWLGRGARSAGDRNHRWTDREPVRRAERLVSRFGAPIVTASFVTLGLQSAIQIASGVLRMPWWPRFVPAALIGAAIWATIYTTIGLTVLYAMIGRLDWWWALVAVIAVVTVVVGSRLLSRRSSDIAD